MKIAGKRFEADFQQSAEKVMFTYRLRDPGSSFNLKCSGCPKQVTRFSIKNICDFVCFNYPNMYLIELKSSKQKAFPFSNIVKTSKDTRLQKMVDAENNHNGVKSFVVFNFRSLDSLTYAVRAEYVLNYINLGERKSVPLEFIKGKGIRVHEKIKKVNYNYDVNGFLIDVSPF